MQKIITNKIKCKLCGDVIESKHHYDFKSCSCGACSVDGGTDYLRRCFKDGYEPEDIYEELSETIPYTEEELELITENRDKILKELDIERSF